LVESREEARRLILAGQVTAEGRTIEKAGTLLAPTCDIRLKSPPHPFASRGGVKLDAALDFFDVDVRGLVALDVGASTGGFTDCLLQRGARKVFAVDVGYGQLAWKLRRDPRVVVLERTNIRYLKPGRLGEKAGLATIDVSFISLKLVLAPVMRLLHAGADIVALVKPQFELGRGRVGKGGIVRDRPLQLEAVAQVRRFAETLGLKPMSEMESPILGADGNREFFLWLREAREAAG